MRRTISGTLGVMVVAIGLTAAATAGAESWVTPFRGHLGLGWTKLMQTDAPAGSIAFSAGVDYPLTSTWRIGPELGYDLLGSSTVERGSLVADLDYSAIEGLVLLHWQPGWPGPIGLVSFGPGIVAARVNQSSSGAARFEDLTVDEVAAAIAGSVTMITRKPSAVRVGLEAGGRLAFVSKGEWALVTIKLVVHY